MALNSIAKQIIEKQLPKAANPETQTLMNAAFLKIKEEMIAEFLQHPVTRELQAGVDSSNISGTLGGITNLFSFIGFRSNYDPIEPILDKLQLINIRFVAFKSKGMQYAVDMPTPKEIFDVTPLPWAQGRSWAKGIESGLSGLGYYLKKDSTQSRSGFGLQSRKRVRKGVKFKNTQYISALINKYEKKFRTIRV